MYGNQRGKLESLPVNVAASALRREEGNTTFENSFIPDGVASTA